LRSEHVEPSIWLKNITDSVAMMIQEERDGGNLVQGIIMTENIYNKLAEAIGYPPVDWLGYVIEVVETPEDQDEEDAQDLIMIRGEPLN